MDTPGDHHATSEPPSPPVTGTVRVIAPSSIGKRSNLVAYKTFLRDRLPAMRAHVADAIFQEGADPFYANTDRFRADDLADALTDDSAVVWCALGGKGASRLVPYLEALPEDRKRRIREARKAFIGFSDITVLHVYLQTVYGWQTIHGTMLEQIADGAVDGGSVDALVSLVDGRASRVAYQVQRVWPAADAPEPPPPLRSRVTGGNLTLVANTTGTAYSFSGAGCIVFLEDRGGMASTVERDLDHLKQAGALDGAAAVVFGSFAEAEPPELLPVALRRFAASVPFPVFRTDRIGHGRVNDPLPLNTDATLTADRIGRDGSATYTLTVANVYARDAGGGGDEGGSGGGENIGRGTSVRSPAADV